RLGGGRTTAWLFSVLPRSLPRRGQPLRSYHRTRERHRRRTNIPHARPAAPRDASLHPHAAVLPAHAMAGTLRRKLLPDRRLHAHHRPHRALEIAAHRVPVRRHHVFHLRPPLPPFPSST